MKKVSKYVSGIGNFEILYFVPNISRKINFSFGLFLGKCVNSPSVRSSKNLQQSWHKIFKTEMRIHREADVMIVYYRYLTTFLV
jgi:hypothetical protein